MALDFEQFLDIINTFSGNLKRNLNLIQDLDQRSETILSSIDKSRDKYIESVNQFSLNQRNDYLNQIYDSFDKAIGYSEDKIGLAQQTYYLVDKQFKLLDSYSDNLVQTLQNIEEQKKRKKFEIKQNIKRVSKQKSTKVLKFTKNYLKQSFDKKTNLVQRRKSINRSEVKNVLIDVKSEEIDLIRSRRSRRTKPIQKSRFNSDHFVFTPFKTRIVAKNKDISMEKSPKAESETKIKSRLSGSVEPNPLEPVFCDCKQISFGEMIKCDQKDCYIQWFHFGCVGLREKPEGKWFCDKCRTYLVD